ncbi:hypothetical protein M9H77_09532 [Catharanthus roseus]|uniref:Uncharacterized protein n=1 Tax=Catharanthus roseus TaxID=4058 RepID=A0ACC0C175_CATRO|nr:hypothetical protein M9H77_09532 [Catharanthus roseus]
MISCETIDDILKCVLQFEQQGQLIKSSTAQNHIESLKFLLRFSRIHLKWKRLLFTQNISGIEKWLEEVERGILVHRGSMTADLLEEILSSLWKKIDQFKKYLGSEYFYHLHNFTDPDPAPEQIDEVIIELLDPVLENLKHLIGCCDPDLPVLTKEKIKELEIKLISLRNFLVEITGKDLETINDIMPRQGMLIKTLEDLLNQIKFLIQHAFSLSIMLWLQDKQYNTDRLILELLAKINHFEPELRMIYVQFLKASKTANPGTIGIDLQALVSVELFLCDLDVNQLPIDEYGSIIHSDAHHELAILLQQNLSFLRYFLMDPQVEQYIKLDEDPESFNSYLIQLEAMCSNGASLTQSILDGSKKDDMAAKGMNLMYSNLLEIVNHLKDKIRQIYLRVPKPSTSDFPRTPKLSFLNFFIQNLEQLLNHRADSIAYVKDEIDAVKTELACLSSFIGDTTTAKIPDEEHENVARRIIDVAYEAERVIDLISATTFPNWYYMLWISDVLEKIKLLSKDTTQVLCRKTCNISVLEMEMEKVSIQAPRPMAYTLVPEEEVVGFNDEVKNIIDLLIGNPKELDIVSIIGMPGLGKTTLAKKVYEHPSVTSHFHLRSWYCISQVYDRRDLLLSILGNCTEVNEQNQKMKEEDMAKVLYQSLKGRRYLIVLDDIWSTKPWNDIRISFPNDYNGSRILFTSRIALQAYPSTRAPNNLRLFSKEESWELLKKKVFQGQNCPPELYTIGKQIAENCKGVPLSVVVIAGILTRTEESEGSWRNILESLGKQVGDSRQCIDVLELSYRHLPDNLKPCFLYLGNFPEDKEIPAWKLIRLWIAEGLVQKTESESLEEVAQSYLKDLIARSLVIVAKNNCNGGVKSCRLHDLLHEFTVEKAKDEKVLQISKHLVNPELYRHCFYFKQNDLHGWMPDDAYARSMLWFPTEKANHSLTLADLSGLPFILKLLRVLDLERLRSGDRFISEIGLMVHLRYLAVRGRFNSVPSSIGNLWRLETLIVYGMEGEVYLPEILLKMAHLKHVCVNKRAALVCSNTFPPPELEPSGSSIQILCRPAFSQRYASIEKVIKSLKNLKKLKCIYLESWDSDKRCNRLPELDSLTELKSLNATYHGIVKLPYEFSFPSSLKKLTLSKFRFPWSEISKIGRLLPQLEALKLLFKAFEGTRWDVNEDDFRNLKFLKLESIDLVEWDVSSDAFPCLEQLVLEKCKKLKDIYSNFGELVTLRRIEVQWCSYSATKAMWEVQQQQQELCGDGLKLLIQPSNWNSAPAS